MLPKYENICPKCGHERYHCIISRYCMLCNENIPWKCIGIIKRVFISMASCKITISGNSVDWDEEFAPEQLLSDIPNISDGGPYFLWKQRIMENDLHDLNKECFVYSIRQEGIKKPSEWNDGIIKL